MWQLGWFQDRTYNIKLSNDQDDKDVFELAFYGDYAKTTQFQPVIARYKNLYLTFNRQKDMNLQTKEYGDMMLAVSEFPGEFHSHSNLEEALGVGSPPFQMKFDDSDNDNIFMEVCSFAPGNDYRPDVLTVVVSRKWSGCPEIKSVTANSQEVPTVLPSDCGVVRSSVELKDTSNPSGIQTETCEAIANDPDRYCNQMDELSKTQVWNICRLQCPQSGCIDSSGRLMNSSYSQSSNPGRCQNIFSSVRVKLTDEFGESQHTTKTCQDLAVGFLSDREYLCSLEDLLTRLSVSEVCKVECPGTECDA
jgi:hypothetical protein